MTKGDAGLVLTIISSAWPARTLVREQYPSIAEERQRLAGSRRGRSSIQVVVPGRAFSARIRPRRAEPTTARAPAWSNARRPGSKGGMVGPTPTIPRRDVLNARDR